MRNIVPDELAECKRIHVRVGDFKSEDFFGGAGVQRKLAAVLLASDRFGATRLIIDYRRFVSSYDHKVDDTLYERFAVGRINKGLLAVDFAAAHELANRFLRGGKFGFFNFAKVRNDLRKPLPLVLEIRRKVDKLHSLMVRVTLADRAFAVRVFGIDGGLFVGIGNDSGDAFF